MEPIIIGEIYTYQYMTNKKSTDIHEESLETT